MNCVNGHKIMGQYGIAEGKIISEKLHEARINILRNMVE